MRQIYVVTAVDGKFEDRTGEWLTADEPTAAAVKRDILRTHPRADVTIEPVKLLDSLTDLAGNRWPFDE